MAITQKERIADAIDDILSAMAREIEVARDSASQVAFDALEALVLEELALDNGKDGE